MARDASVWTALVYCINCLQMAILEHLSPHLFAEPSTHGQKVYFPKVGRFGF
ncbi:hypothetical protein FHS27_002681 [Rhodopirellula rubra]|uniref:Uncharacterized protein n=1 Tax=Aporhodopirellula rubra TaxID=980271 RepID=A0A7W5E084_9BACT|nr:hypothetical protein [Aporhodopirellula rubra]